MKANMKTHDKWYENVISCCIWSDRL